MAENPTYAAFQPKISLETPLADYKALIAEKMESDELIDDDEMRDSYAKISAVARDTIWKLLFEEQPAKPEQLAKAAECLNEHKMDASFHGPYDYNEWIPKVRDELLKRNMLDFWRNQIVKRELGPCWARDSDFFDDMEDEEPAKFYEFAGCEAPFKKAKKAKLDDTAKSTAESSSATTQTSTAATPVPNKISLTQPKEDYKAMVEQQNNEDPDNEEAFKKIFAEVREVIWQLLFGGKPEEPLSADNYAKAAACLEAYKQDACFYSPHDYNAWIPKVRDELFARKYLDFWQNVVLEKKLGLCWYKDCDLFDDTEDKKPEEFYKSGDELLKNWKKE